MTTAPSIALPSRVYKYVTQDRIDVLQSLTVRFTQPSALNDPFDLAPLVGRMLSEEEFERKLDTIDKIAKSYEELDKALDKRTDKMNPVNINPQPSETIKDKSIEIKNALISLRLKTIDWNRLRPCHYRAKYIEVVSGYGILSLSSSPIIPNLWAHYAQNSKGFIFEFDTSNAFFLNSLGNVHYIDRDPLSRSINEVDAKDIFFTKAKSWAYEAEWRVVESLEKAKTKIIVNGEDIYLFEIPASALTRVIMGANASSDLVAKIKDIIHSYEALSHIEVAKIHINLVTHSLDILPLEV